MSEGLNDPLEQATAWLQHDVLEDSTVTRRDLLEAGIPGGVVEAVTVLTRTDAVSDADYYAGIRANPIALAVTRADIADNLEPWRVKQLDVSVQERLAAKYGRALG